MTPGLSKDIRRHIRHYIASSRKSPDQTPGHALMWAASLLY